MFKLHLAWIAALCLVCLSIPIGAAAQASPVPTEAPRFGIHPVGDYENGWFEVIMEPATQVTLTAGIQNAGTIGASLLTYATNAVNPPNGGFAAGTSDDELTEPALWATYPAESFALNPGEGKEVDFTVSVPAGTPPGEYVIALVAQTAESLEISGTDTLRQILRSAVSVEITVPGEMTSGFELGEPEFSPVGAGWRLDIAVTNTGTARVRPQGEIVLTTAAGDEIVTSPVEMGSVYGGNISSIQIALPQQLPTDDYLISAVLEDEATGATASIDQAPVAFAVADVVEAPTFVVEGASVVPNADPLQFANVSATITNNAAVIPTANVTLNVQRDGEAVESYPLAQNQALASGVTELTNRYIPIDGWLAGSYTFQLVVSSVDTGSGTETILATIDVPEGIDVS